MSDAQAFAPLVQELDRWRADGRSATFWWRDDDACVDSPALSRLLSLAARYRVPVAIAAIPAAVESSLVSAIGACECALVVQHGYAHRNHAASGARSAELAEDRAADATLAELARGRRTLAAAFGDRFATILVPPWNRIADHLLPHLRDEGYAGLSRFGPRASPFAAPGVPEVNTHVDPIAWRRGRAFVGIATAVARIVAHLHGRREKSCDAGEPTGLLTHHLAFGDDAFAFVDALLDVIARHDAARWLDPRDAFVLSELTCARCA
jgi:peptidoglycan/xylan/chitin deacetylase (PgdA/CDA1 family)